MAHGKTGYVTVGGTTWCATEWSVSGSVDDVDVTTFCSDGTREFIGGFEEWEGSVTLLDSKGNLLDTTATAVLGNDECTYTGSILFNTHEATNDVESRFELTWGFKFTGAVVIADA